MILNPSLAAFHLKESFWFIQPPVGLNGRSVLDTNNSAYLTLAFSPSDFF
jgi:hypothetical protein